MERQLPSWVRPLRTLGQGEGQMLVKSYGGERMTRIALSGVLIALAICLAVLFGAAPDAKAGLSSYCGNQVLGGWQQCPGAQRTMYAAYGWGDEHSVCVGVSQLFNVTCSGGAGEGTYNPLGQTGYFTPIIRNHAAGNNRVHGVAYQP